MIQVNAGDLWEFDNPEGYPIERHALMWIVKVGAQGDDPNKDIFTYLVLDDDEEQFVSLKTTHLTMRTKDYGRYWKKVA